jgi:uncharacterized membrane-anchored protein
MNIVPAHSTSTWLNKVPEVTRGVMGALLAIALFKQLSTRRYS